MQDADPDQPAARLLGALARGCPTAPSSPPTRARPRTGSRATCRLRDGMMASLSGTLATMGRGVPYAIAAKFAHPDRPAIALVGDGAMQMNGLNELITVAKYWQRWSDPRLVVLVLNNRDLNQVTWEQRAMQGDPMYPATQDDPRLPVRALRRARRPAAASASTTRSRSAGPGTTRSRPTGPSCSRRSSIRRCRRCRRTSRFEQAKHFAQAALAGDPRRGRDDPAVAAADARRDYAGTMSAATRRSGPRSRRSRRPAYTVPTDLPESDGTLEWDSTTIVVVEVAAGGESGVGWTYAPAAAAALVEAAPRAGRRRGSTRSPTGAAHAGRCARGCATPVSRASARWRCRPSTSRSGI